MRGHRWRGAAVVRSGGLPPRFFMGFLCPVARSQSYRGLTDRWRGGAVRFVVGRLAPSLGALLSLLSNWCALCASANQRTPAHLSGLNSISATSQPCNRCCSSSHAASPRCCRRLHGNTARAASCAWAGACVEINQCAGCTRQFFTKSFPAAMTRAVLARSRGEEPAPPRHRAGVASMAWRRTRRFSANAP